MSEQKMRDEFESWCKENPILRSYMWMAWQAACASKQKEIDALKFAWKHSCSESQYRQEQQIRELAAQVAVMQEALQNVYDEYDPSNHDICGCNCEPDTGYICALCIFHNSPDWLKVKSVLTIIPSEALAQHDAEVSAKALEDAADWFANQQGWGRWAANELRIMAAEKTNSMKEN